MGNPYCSIQTAIDYAVDTDNVVVAPGTYVERIDFLGKAITVRSAGGPGVTTIDGNGAIHVVVAISGEGPATVLDGFTITGGNANGAPPDDRGGGMYVLGSSPTVRNCIFSGNAATGPGGAMAVYNVGSSPTVTGCNSSSGAGKRSLGSH